MRDTCERPSGMILDLLGHSYHCECHGDPGGEAVLFLHGFSQSSRTWRPVRFSCAMSFVMVRFARGGASML
jgi:pimeloyl-ACP methyl ester carboxylesterase